MLGVDEHTAALLEVEARVLTVAGSGRGDRTTTRRLAHFRGRGVGVLRRSRRHAPGRRGRVVVHLRATADAAPAEDDCDRFVAGRDGRRGASRLRAGVRRRDVERCVAVALGLEHSIAEWHADTLQSDDEPRARRALRAMVVRLGELAEAGADPRGQVAPVVELLLELRARPATTATSPLLIWCATGSSRRASRCVTHLTECSGSWRSAAERRRPLSGCDVGHRCDRRHRHVLAGCLLQLALRCSVDAMASLKVPSLGDYIREQREHAQVSLRQLAKNAGVSNPYLSQIERGLKKPSAEILAQIAKGLRISAETLYVRAGILEDRGTTSDVVGAVLADLTIDDRQKRVLLDIYESFRSEHQASAANGRARRRKPRRRKPRRRTSVAKAAAKQAASNEERPRRRPPQ